MPFDRSRLTLRDARADPRADDTLCLGTLAAQVFLHTYATDGINGAIAREVQVHHTPAAMAQWIAAPGSVVLVAEHGGHLVGFAQLQQAAAQALAPAGAQAELVRLYVQEPFTRHGVGTALLRAAEARAQAGGATVLWLTPWAHNHRALAFYARCGYADCGLTHYWIEGVGHENRVLAKQLELPAQR